MDTLGKHRKYLYESGGEQVFIQKDKLPSNMREEENLTVRCPLIIKLNFLSRVCISLPMPKNPTIVTHFMPPLILLI